MRRFIHQSAPRDIPWKSSVGLNVKGMVEWVDWPPGVVGLHRLIVKMTRKNAAALVSYLIRRPYASREVLVRLKRGCGEDLKVDLLVVVI